MKGMQSCTICQSSNYIRSGFLSNLLWSPGGHCQFVTTYWAHLQKLWAEPGSGNNSQAVKICKLAKYRSNPHACIIKIRWCI